MPREKPTLQSLLEHGCTCKTPLGSDGTETHWGRGDIPNGLVLVEKAGSGFCVVAPCLNHALTYMECWPKARTFSYAGYEALTEEEFQQTAPKKRITRTRQLQHQNATMDNLTSSRSQWEAIFGENVGKTKVSTDPRILTNINYRDYIGSQVKVLSTHTGAGGALNAIGTLVPDNTESHNGCCGQGPKVRVEVVNKGKGLGGHRIGEVWALGLKNVKLEVISVLRKYPESKELQVVQMYGTKDPKIRGVAELSSLRGFKAEDFEFTGEFRKPKKGEHSLSTVFNVVLNSFDKRYDRLILKKRA